LSASGFQAETNYSSSAVRRGLDSPSQRWRHAERMCRPRRRSGRSTSTPGNAKY
jgi:hypothetical protein